MKITKLFYFTRISELHIEDKILFESGFAAENKILNFSKIFKNINIKTYRLGIVRDSKYRFNKALVTRSNKNIYLIPPYIKLFKSNKLNYLLNIFVYSFWILSLRRRFKNSLFLSYNFLPDTILPFLFLSLLNGGYKFIEVEELLFNDYEAPRIFGIVEIFLRKIICFDLIIAARNSIADKLKGSSKVVVNGILSDEKIILFEYYLKIYEENLNKVLFLGRFDDMRGLDEFIEAAGKYKLDNPKTVISIIGYSNSELSVKDIFIKAKLNLKKDFFFYLNATDEIVARELVTSKVVVSLVKNRSFLEYSFPSKLIEFLYLNKNIVSLNMSELNDISNFIWIKCVTVECVREGLKDAFQSPKFYDGKDWVLKNATIKAVQSKLVNSIVPLISHCGKCPSISRP
jgi:glycosyltransferase involved in cell wall biosynthesis